MSLHVLHGSRHDHSRVSIVQKHRRVDAAEDFILGPNQATLSLLHFRNELLWER